MTHFEPTKKFQQLEIIERWISFAVSLLFSFTYCVHQFLLITLNKTSIKFDLRDLGFNSLSPSAIPATEAVQIEVDNTKILRLWPIICKSSKAFLINRS